jgi:hypothetical protein
MRVGSYIKFKIADWKTNNNNNYYSAAEENIKKNRRSTMNRFTLTGRGRKTAEPRKHTTNPTDNQ